MDPLKQSTASVPPERWGGRWRARPEPLSEVHGGLEPCQCCDCKEDRWNAAGCPEPDHSAHGGDLCTEGPDGCCTVCCMDLSVTCEVCGGRGYHRDTCDAADSWDDSPEGRS